MKHLLHYYKYHPNQVRIIKICAVKRTIFHFPFLTKWSEIRNEGIVTLEEMLGSEGRSKFKSVEMRKSESEIWVDPSKVA